METALWLLISISSIASDGYQAEAYKDVNQCTAELRRVAEQQPQSNPVCVHNTNPWRRYSVDGPNVPEILAIREQLLQRRQTPDINR